jgi:hypothetical protein
MGKGRWEGKLAFQALQPHSSWVLTPSSSRGTGRSRISPVSRTTGVGFVRSFLNVSGLLEAIVPRSRFRMLAMLFYPKT